jgi:hypothetical protein
MDCSSASDAARVRGRGDGVQWPKERKPIIFHVAVTVVAMRVMAGLVPAIHVLLTPV